MALGQASCSAIVSIASTLDHCHVPGRTEHAMLASDEIELGTGPHNEPVSSHCQQEAFRKRRERTEMIRILT